MPRLAPTWAQRAIVESRAAGMAPAVVRSRLLLGTLPGFEGQHFEFQANRTWWNEWERARDELRTAGAPTAPEGPTLIERIAADLERRRDGDAGPDAERPRDAFGDQLAERSARITRGKAMIAEGASLEEAAEAMQMPVYEARYFYENALTEKAA